MVIQTNMPGIHTMHENIKIRGSVSKTIEKLSSGFRINRAADDAAGLGVSESMRAQITELARAQRNVQEGIDVTNTADGALAEINSMLIRARELCIEGANGIYSQTELDAISDELNEIFDDIDRITEGTNFNDIQLFRFHGSTEETPLPEVKHKYTYTDHFTPVADLEEWGELTLLKEKEEPFGDPIPAIPATATFKLEKDIELDNAMTMDGKSIQIGSSLFYFDGGGYLPPDGATSIQIQKGETVQQVLNKIKSHSFFYPYGHYVLKDIKVDNDKNVTFSGPLTLLRGTVIAEDGIYDSSMPEGNAVYAHRFPITSSEKTSIMQVDGDDTNNNPIIYASTASFLCQPPSELTQDDINNLKYNTLHIGDLKIPLKDAGFQLGDKRDDIGNKLVDLITNGNNSNITAEYTNGFLKVTIKGLNSNGPTENIPLAEYIGEISNGNEILGGALQFNSLNLKIVDIQKPAAENLHRFTITVPSSPSPPFSFTFKGQTYLFYDSDKTGKFPPDDFPKIKYTPNYHPSSINWVNTKDWSSDKILQEVINIIKFPSDQCDKSVSGNVITITAKKNNQYIDCSLHGIDMIAQSYKNDSPEYSEPVLLDYGPSWSQNVSVSFDLGDDISQLAGKGFGFNPTGSRDNICSFEFVDQSHPSLRDNYLDIDISTCTSMEEVCTNVEKIMRYTGYYTVSLDGSIMTITSTRRPEDKAASVTDGYHDIDGIFTNHGDEDLSKNFSGGVNSDNSQISIDFSSINSDNIDTLLGKGFRITCASCNGEYINIYFCWENDSEATKSFQVPDPDAPNDPSKIRTIHNLAVELSKFSNGKEIVQNIVDQLTPQLKHLTGVKVGDPPTKLIAYEKRVGKVYDVTTGERQIAKVISGVFTNFKYSYDKIQTDPISTPDASTPSGDEENKIDFWKMLIYAGSEPDHQWIPIHLPYLDLPTLHLSPPDKVDLGSGEDPFDWLERVDAANDLIITSRTRIGADYNRLEHTYSALTQTRENIEDAESRIRDADMAKLMVQYMKDQIIGQAQQSMMLHSNERPQQILELLK